MIRAKFRCMGVNHRWNGEKFVEMLPVTHRQSYTTGDEVEAEENLSFWKATPGGSVKLTYIEGQECPFEPGHYYYVDFEEGEGPWKLRSVQQFETSLTISMSTGWGGEDLHHGEVEMTIDNEAAWGHFDNKVGRMWSVGFSPT